MTTGALERAILGWNRDRLDLASDEILAQILGRDDLAAWQELYALAAADPALRRRLLVLIERVPLPYPHSGSPLWPVSARASTGRGRCLPTRASRDGGPPDGMGAPRPQALLR